MTTSSERVTEDDPTLRGSVPSVRDLLSTFVVGLFMGTADAVPGVSGGTIALIAGIYDRLVTAVAAVTPRRAVRFVRALLPVEGGVDARGVAGVIEEVDAWFLVALLTGILAAVVSVTGVVAWAARPENYPTLLFGVFFGLIAASALILLREIRLDTPAEIAAAVAGFVVAFVASGLREGLTGGGLALVFVGGMVGVSAMILPGISGSLMLVILGQYKRLSTALHDFIDALGAAVTDGSTAGLVQHGTVVGTFVLGGLVGLFTVARAIRWALDRNRTVTLAFLVALVVGALRAPVATLNGPDYAIAWTADAIGAFAGAAVVGAAVVLVLDWYAVDIDLESV